jgi:hypothetical protein
MDTFPMQTDQNEHTERPRSPEKDLNKHQKQFKRRIEGGIFSLLSSIILFLLTALLISWAWNHIVVDMLSALVILPFVTPIQVAAFKLILNYVNPFK